LVFPRIYIFLGPGASAHVIEEYSGEGEYSASAVSEICLCEGASLRHDVIQCESLDAFHFGSVCVDIAKSAALASTTVAFGAAVSRHCFAAAMTGECAELELNGLSMADCGQIAETFSSIDHTAPSCTSRQTQKNILDGSSKGIFHGNVMVRQSAQKTIASQSNRNLLLSERASAETMPQLEILADDVKCGHGATVGHLNEDELFYMQSRGLDLRTAKNLLVAGFAAEIISRVGPPSLVDKLIGCVIRKGQS
jgi:Fe-S cluster assembly protein SufD